MSRFGETNYKAVSVFSPHPKPGTNPKDATSLVQWLCHQWDFSREWPGIRISPRNVSYSHTQTTILPFSFLPFFSDIRECGIYILIRFLFTCTWENNQSFSCLSFIQKVPPRELRVIPYRPVRTCPGEWPFLQRLKRYCNISYESSSPTDYGKSKGNPCPSMTWK